MGYPRTMGAGLAGSTTKIYGNANVNQIQYGDKLQGLPPVTGRRDPYRIYKTKAGGNAPGRFRVFCVNQLGGIGMANKNSQFAPNADGLGWCPNRKNSREGDIGINKADRGHDAIRFQSRADLKAEFDVLTHEHHSRHHNPHHASSSTQQNLLGEFLQTEPEVESTSCVVKTSSYNPNTGDVTWNAAPSGKDCNSLQPTYAAGYYIPNQERAVTNVNVGSFDGVTMIVKDGKEQYLRGNLSDPKFYGCVSQYDGVTPGRWVPSSIDGAGFSCKCSVCN